MSARGRSRSRTGVVAAALVASLASLAGVAGTARAEPQGAAFLHYELSGLHGVDDPAAVAGDGPRIDVRDLVLAGARLHGLYGRTVAYHAGFDFALGATVNPGGFAYDVSLLPVGVGLRLGRTSILAVASGVGAMGAVGTLDDAVTLPVEAVAEVGLGPARLLARARVAWVAGADGRQGGAPDAPFGDELDATLGLRIGHHYEDYGFPTGNGYFLGASVRELAGQRFFGLTLGYSIDMATRPSRPI